MDNCAFSRDQAIFIRVAPCIPALFRLGRKGKGMFINYKLADGSYILVEVTEEVAAMLAEDDRRAANADRKERYHTPYSIDALDFEGMEFAYCETPESICIRKEENEHMKELLAHLTDTQLRRLQMRADGMTLRGIAASEETSVNAIKCSLYSVRKIFEKYL